MAILEENDILFAYKALNLMNGLSDATKRVAGAIIDHFNKRTGQCDPSIDRLAAMLGIDRATVLRATEKLHDMGLIEKLSHGGKSHRAAYIPNWSQFRRFVEDWDAKMKESKADRNKQAIARTEKQMTNVAETRPSRSQDCDVQGRSAATQTLRINQSNKPIRPECAEKPRKLPSVVSSGMPQSGLSKGNKPIAQRAFLLPFTGGRNVSHELAAASSAERRWDKDALALGQKTYADVIEWMTEDTQKAATQAELARKGGGIAYIISAMQNEQMQVRSHAVCPFLESSKQT